MTLNFDVVIIGGGVAGMTAAIYLKRSNKNVCIIEKSTPGGLINISSTIENYPGYKKIQGPELAYQMYEQVKELDIPFNFTKVTEIKDNGEYKEIKTPKGTITCKKIIIATGREAKKLMVEDVDKLTGKGISYCALCDGALYKGKDVAVVGAGNSALEEALYLSDICKKVYLLDRRDVIRGDDILVDQISKKDNIEILYNTEIKEFIKENEILKKVKITKDNNLEELEVSAVFVFIGYKPATDFLKDLGITDDKGYIVCDHNYETKIKGIYAAGDVVYKNAFQIITAANDGALAAVACTKELEK